MIKRIAALVIAETILFTSAFSAYSLAAETRTGSLDRENQSLEYSFGDIAAAELAIYGILPEPFLKPQQETRAAFGRQEAVAMLYNMFSDNAEADGLCSTHPFTDEDEQYDEAISWAYQRGVTLGISDTVFGTEILRKASL